MLSVTLKCLSLLIISFSLNVPPARSDSVEIQRLTWAGVKLSNENTTVFIDTMATDIWDGAAPEKFVEPEANTPRRYALITHVHNDHFDAEGLHSLLGERGYVICHQPIAAYVASRGFKVIPVALNQSVSRGGFWFTALPASDGFGDAQVSWLVSTGTQKVFHGGDTLWHGEFERIGAQYGPIDIAFLPINGVSVPGPLGAYSPRVMTPQQAVDAAKLLRAKVISPIHFGVTSAPGYVEVEKPLQALRDAVADQHLSVVHLVPGDSLPQ